MQAVGVPHIPTEVRERHFVVTADKKILVYDSVSISFPVKVNQHIHYQNILMLTKVECCNH